MTAFTGGSFTVLRVAQGGISLLSAAREAKTRAMLTTEYIAGLRAHRLFRGADL